MVFGVLDVADRFRHPHTRVRLHVDQEVIDRFGNFLIGEVPNRVRLKSGRMAEWQVSRAGQEKGAFRRALWGV